MQTFIRKIKLVFHYKNDVQKKTLMHKCFVKKYEQENIKNSNMELSKIITTN
jgi:hypothetical protein